MKKGEADTETTKVVVGLCVMALPVHPALGFASKHALSTEKMCVKMLEILRLHQFD